MCFQILEDEARGRRVHTDASWPLPIPRSEGVERAHNRQHLAPLAATFRGSARLSPLLFRLPRPITVENLLNSLGTRTSTIEI